MKRFFCAFGERLIFPLICLVVAALIYGALLLSDGKVEDSGPTCSSQTGCY